MATVVSSEMKDNHNADGDEDVSSSGGQSSREEGGTIHQFYLFM